MADHVSDEDHVLISLTSDPQSDSPDSTKFPHRKYCLARFNNSMPIGRASKVPSKNLMAAEHNGWYDTPVMSRNHATLTADFDSKVVNLADCGSLHGTFINGEQLKSHSNHVLAAGDKVQFGMAISRNQETYSPMEVKVGIDFREGSRPAGSTTFRAPEVIDVDYESEDGSIEEVAADKTVIDLTSPSRAESPDDELGDLSDLPDMHPSDQPDEFPPTQTSPVLAPEDDDSIHLSSDSDGDMEDFNDSEDPSDNELGAEMDEVQEYETEEMEAEEYSESEDFPTDDPSYWDDAPSDEDFDPYKEFNDQPDEANAPTMVPPAYNAVTTSVQPPKSTSACNISAILNPDEAVQDVYTKSGYTAAAMGDLTGKHEYFNARHFNKATLATQMQQSAEVEESTSPDQFFSTQTPAATVMPAPELSQHIANPRSGPSNEAVATVNTNDITQAVTPKSDGDAPSAAASSPEPVVKHLASSTLLEAGEKFLNTPPKERDMEFDLDMDKSNGEEDDEMRSAAVFHQKRSASAKDGTGPASANDVAGLASVEDGSSFKKRKASEISRITKVKVTELQANLDAGPGAEDDDESAERPAKRPATGAAVQAKTAEISSKSKAWAVAEKITLAAVGGVLVLGGMIYTAPTF